MTDEQLLHLVANNDIDAYQILYDRHAATINSLILRIVRHPSIAEELLQDVFWQIWKNADQFDERGAAKAWMFQISRNCSIDELRRQKTRPRPAEGRNMDVVFQSLQGEHPSAETEVENRLDRQEILVILNDIPDEQQVCIELAYFGGLSHSEIADILDIPKGTVKSRLRRGMEKLERGLRSVGYP